MSRFSLRLKDTQKQHTNGLRVEENSALELTISSSIVNTYV